MDLHRVRVMFHLESKEKITRSNVSICAPDYFACGKGAKREWLVRRTASDGRLSVSRGSRSVEKLSWPFPPSSAQAPASMTMAWEFTFSALSCWQLYTDIRTPFESRPAF